MARRRRVVIVGAGISGLSTAYFLSQKFSRTEAEITLLEASSHFGGIILTEHFNGFVLEAGPDSFLSQKPEALELCKRLQLEQRLIESLEAHRQAYVLSQGVLQPFPRGLLLSPPLDYLSLLRSPLLSWKGRLRAALGPLISPSRLEDESVADFVRRRLGKEVLERVAEPLVAGIYGGDAGQLSIRSAFPQLHQAERMQRSLTRTVSQKAAESGPAERRRRESVFLSLRGGMGELVEKLMESLQDRVSVRLQTKVLSVRPGPAGFQLQARGNSSWDADAVVLATPSHISAALLHESYASIAAILGQIPYASATTVCLGYRGECLAGRAGSGFLVSRSEDKALLACTWVSRKFPHRCPPGHTLLRCFVGSAGTQASLADDESLLLVVRKELEGILGIDARPIVERVYRMKEAMPQYVVGHDSRVKHLNQALQSTPGLCLVGNFLDGVGLPDCIRHAKKVALVLGSSNSV